MSLRQLLPSALASPTTLYAYVNGNGIPKQATQKVLTKLERIFADLWFFTPHVAKNLGLPVSLHAYRALNSVFYSYL